MADAISDLKIDDEQFLVTSLIERCPKQMMLRELFQNAMEAAATAPIGKRIVRINSVAINGTPKLRIWNTGRGMDEDELRRMCDLSSSIGKEKGLTKNFGMGAKVAALASNKLGIRYRSCKQGQVSEVIMAKRDGKYGRVWQRLEGGHDFSQIDRRTDVVDRTMICERTGMELAYDWTEVVLFGNREHQNTCIDPYDGEPDAMPFWLPDSLYRRYFRKDDTVQVFLDPEVHWFDEERRFETLSERLPSSFTHFESVKVGNSISIHYVFDAAHNDRPWENQSSEAALQSSRSFVSLAYKNEFYDYTQGSAWAYEAPNYGIPYAARHISIIIEVQASDDIITDAYRLELRRVSQGGERLAIGDYKRLVRENRPSWLLDRLREISGDTTIASSLQEELAALTRELGVDKLGASEPQSDDITRSTGAQTPSGVEIVLLRDHQDVVDRWLDGRAACFYPNTNQLFINMNYEAISKLSLRLANDPAVRLAPQIGDEIIRDVAEKSIVRRISRALMYAMAKHLDQDRWQQGHIEKAMSPEALSLIADDYQLLLKDDIASAISAAS